MLNKENLKLLNPLENAFKNNFQLRTLARNASVRLRFPLKTEFNLIIKFILA